MKNNKIFSLAQGALIAALYAAATYLSAAFGIAYGGIQFRFSEALMIFSVFSPAAIPGLTIGCILGNLASPIGIWDIIFGSLATLLSTLSARKLRNIKLRNLPVLSLLMPVIFNGLIVGAELTALIPGAESGVPLFIINSLEVMAGELTVCLAGEIPLYYALKKSNIFTKQNRG